MQFPSCDVMLCHHPGGGIYADRGGPYFDDRAIANNGLIVSASNDLRLECVSSQSEEGMITGHDGNTIPLGVTGVWRLTNPFHRPGVLRLQTHNALLSPITAADQGIYTCTLPDSNDNQIVINIGLYPSGFNGERHVYTLCVGEVWDVRWPVSQIWATVGTR